MERERESAPLRTSVLAFAGFELDTATEELRRHGHPVALQPQPLKLLGYLASRPGELVTRAELQKLLWGEFSEVDVEHGLNFCIAQIRAALGDAGGAEGLVETLPRRGYRFRPPAPPISPAAEPRPALVALSARPDAPLPRSARSGGRGRWLLAAVAVLAIPTLWTFLAAHRRAAPSAEAHAAALEAVRQARSLRLQGDRVAVKQSIAAFEQALLLAPELPGLRAELAATYLDSAQGDLWGKEAMEKARGLAVRALQAEPDSSIAETTLGMVRLQLDWAWEDARRHLERGVALDPARPEARTAHAVYLSASGNPQEAVRVIEPVAGGAPTMVRSKLAWHLSAAGRDPEAIALLRSVLQEEPKQPWPRMQLVTALFRLGRDDEAFAEVKILLAVYEAPPHRVAKVTALPAHAAVVEFFRGRAVNQAGAADSGAAIDPCEVALFYELAGEREPALAWLERAAREKSRWLFPLATADPTFERLRSEPRYRALQASWAR